MDNNNFFEKNLAALARTDADLAARLSRAKPTNLYTFIQTPNGQTIPALTNPSTATGKALHSTIDPKREARRLIETSAANGFVILLGLGGGYYAEAALEQKDVTLVLLIDYDINGVAELFRRKDYSAILNDPRFHLLVSPGQAEIEQHILARYQPLFHGSIQTIPLRARTASESAFANASLAIERALKRVSADYSVQAYFGTRWFSNIIRNLETAVKTNRNPWPRIQNAAVTAAGPSLQLQLPLIREKKARGLFLIATDTSLPALLAHSIVPDAVVTIDCQHISYYHYLAGLPEETTLYIDAAGPPLVASRTRNIRFFRGNHPLSTYIHHNCLSLPHVDTSGGNVTFTAIALAETLGAGTVELYGADFSYPFGESYVRGAYIHPLFEKSQQRLAPIEARRSTFLYRGPLTKITQGETWYYESPSLTFYRQNLEETFTEGRIRVIPAKGNGAPIHIHQSPDKPKSAVTDKTIQNGAVPKTSAHEFLLRYRDEIKALPIHNEATQNSTILVTILPTAAAIKRKNPALAREEILSETKKYCVMQIERVLQDTRHR